MMKICELADCARIRVWEREKDKMSARAFALYRALPVMPIEYLGIKVSFLRGHTEYK